jgi:hypothetical protein
MTIHRDTANALVLGIASVAAGAAVLYAIGRYLGWWIVALIVAAAIGDSVWCLLQLPRRWRPW